jgi:hypothetical protein
MHPDTAATSHFYSVKTSTLHNQQRVPEQSSIKVLIPDGSTMSSTHVANLPLPHLSPIATKAHGFTHLASGSLLSIGQLCDAGCTAIFTNNEVTVHHNNNLILHGHRNLTSKLWDIHLPTSLSSTSKSISSTSKTSKTSSSSQSKQKSSSSLSSNNQHLLNASISTNSLQERISFHHAAMFSPAITTWCQAINKGFLTTWPELTSKQINKFPPQSIAMIKGHKHATRSNIQSTKKFNNHSINTITSLPSSSSIIPTTSTSSINSSSPTSIPIPFTEPSTLRTYNTFASCQPITGKTFSDQTGRFICPSISGNQYLFVLYDYDSNTIHAEPIPSRTKHQILQAFKKVTTKLERCGFKPQLHRLDNEASNLLKDYMHDQNIDFQLTPVGIHRRNLAERAIQTFKNHFISGLCSTHPDFPLNLWDKLVPQAIITLNLLRPSRVNPKISGYMHLFGAFNYNRTPFAPPGMKILVHERPEERSSYAPHSITGWYLGPSLQHYRCHRVWIPSTASERVAVTVTWLPHHFKMPTPSSTDIIQAAAKDLTSALQQHHSPTILPSASTENLTALKQLSTIFTNSSKSSTSQPAELPRVALPAPLIASTPPVNKPATTASFHNITSTINRQRRINRKNQIAQTPPLPPSQSSAPSSCSPSSHSSSSPSTTSPRRSTRLKYSTQKPQFAYAIQHIAQQEFINTINHTSHCANAVLDPITGTLQEYRDLIKGPDHIRWKDACSKEFARLLDGRKKDSTAGRNAMFFIPHNKLPSSKRPTYLRVCANYRPQKADPYRVRFTVGGNLIHYPGNVHTPTADITTAKILFNSVLSTPKAKFMGIDLSDFYLITDMDDYEYMYIPEWIIPPDIMEEYNLKPLIKNGLLLVEIRKGMYGLPQAGRLAYIKLAKHLATHGYIPTNHTPGLFKHLTRPIQFSLVVDDFGIKYIGKENALHLINCLKQEYPLTIDWEGSIFCGIHLKWDYTKRTVDLSMPNYVAKALKRFNHPPPSSPQHSPHPWNAPQYGSGPQLIQPSNHQPLTPAQLKYCQEITGTFLYYARAVDNTMMMPIGSIATSVSTSSWKDLQHRINHFLDYASTHPDAFIRYSASDMTYWIHTDASYLSESKARSRAGGYHYLSDTPTFPIKSTDPLPKHNAPILINSKIIDAVMSSAQEAETGAGFLNAKDAIPIRNTLQELGHSQPATPIQFDNKVATGIITDTVTQRKSKSMDMRFYWIRDRTRQNQFHPYWKSGKTNLGDYHTKHHATKHHEEVRPLYVLNSMTLTNLKSLIIQHLICKGVLKSISPTPSQVGKGLQFQINRCNSRLAFQPPIIK